MKTIRRFAARLPIVFLLSLGVGWYVINLILSFSLRPLANPTHRTLLTQLIPTLVFLAYFLACLVILWRIGWLRPAGILSFGGWQIWTAGLLILLYKLITGFYAYYGSSLGNYTLSSVAYLYPFFLDSAFSPPSDQSAMLIALVFSLYYETVYRGVVPFTLALGWNRYKWGLFASALVPALLYGLAKVNYPAYGYGVETLWLSRLSASLTGFWLAALVLRWGSIWPGVLIYFLVSLIPSLPNGIFDALRFQDYTTIFVELSLFEIPLVIFGIWLILHTPPKVRPQVESQTQ